MEPFKQLTVVIDQDANECLYINGKCWSATGETTVYATDLAAAAAGEPVILRHIALNIPEHVSFSDVWPESLGDVLKYAE